jgi:RNA polymerase sigma-70 factor (ECF subfamily)
METTHPLKGQQDQERIPIAAQAASPEAFAELHVLYYRRLYKTIVAITKNPQDAEDALQDTFLRAYLAIHKFEGRSNIYSWLTRIAINSALMILRKKRVRAEVLFDPEPDAQLVTLSFEVRDSAPNPEEAYDLDQRQLKTLRAIRRLHPHLRAAIRMQLMHGWSVQEISHALNISEAAVKSRLHRARKRLFSAQFLDRPVHPIKVQKKTDRGTDSTVTRAPSSKDRKASLYQRSSGHSDSLWSRSVSGTTHKSK